MIETIITGLGYLGLYTAIGALFAMVWMEQSNGDDDAFWPACVWPITAPMWAGGMIGIKIVRSINSRGAGDPSDGDSHSPTTRV